MTKGKKLSNKVVDIRTYVCVYSEPYLKKQENQSKRETDSKHNSLQVREIIVVVIDVCFPLDVVQLGGQLCNARFPESLLYLADGSR